MDEEGKVKRILDLVSEKSSDLQDELGSAINSGTDSEVMSEILLAQITLLDSLYAEIKAME
jgi:hypothetical protein